MQYLKIVAGYYAVQQHRPQLEFDLRESLPVGLVNAHQTTCWFNVVTQLLYHIPKFRSLIPEIKLANLASAESKEIVEDLQNLFVAIMFSEIKKVDPLLSVNKIGKLLGSGHGQQDACEYLGLLLNRVNEAQRDVVTDLFIGNYRIRKSGNVTSNEDFMQHHLQINSDSDLRSALTCSLEMNTPEDRKFFEKLPPVFLIDLCRLMHNAEPNGLTKVNFSLAFPSVIFMDEFMYENCDRVQKNAADLGNLVAHKNLRRLDSTNRVSIGFIRCARVSPTVGLPQQLHSRC